MAVAAASLGSVGKEPVLRSSLYSGADPNQERLTVDVDAGDALRPLGLAGRAAATVMARLLAWFQPYWSAP
jgi:hypothetical protein